MAKNDYISDDLITMRDRLRESTAALREAAEQKRNPPPENAKETPENAKETPENAASSMYLGPSFKTREDTAAEPNGMREKRDLAARLVRDSARLEKQLADLDARRTGTQQARDALVKLTAELDALTPDDPHFATTVEQRRREYFRLCGTLDALAPAGSGQGSPEERGRSDAELAEKVRNAAWIVGLAVLAAAGIIAGVIAAVFR